MRIFPLGSSGMRAMPSSEERISHDVRTFVPSFRIDRPENFTITSARSTGLPSALVTRTVSFVRSAESSGTETRSNRIAFRMAGIISRRISLYCPNEPSIDLRPGSPESRGRSLPRLRLFVERRRFRSRGLSEILRGLPRSDQSPYSSQSGAPEIVVRAHSADPGFRFDDEHRLPAQARGTRRGREFPGDCRGRSRAAGQRLLLL